jgi:hypothetical protein
MPILAKGGDYSLQTNWQRLAADFNKQGRTFAGRYMQYSRTYRDGRCLSKEEAEILAAHNIKIFTWWENSPQHIGHETEIRASRGRQAGIEDAKRADDIMQMFGQPHAPIYFTVDWDLSWVAVRAYFEGARDTVGFDRMGMYAGAAPLIGAHNTGMCKFFCQPKAWKYKMGWQPFTHLRQCEPWIGATFKAGGIRCDDLRAYATDIGAWLYGKPYGAVVPPVTPPVTPPKPATIPPTLMFPADTSHTAPSQFSIVQIRPSVYGAKKPAYADKVDVRGDAMKSPIHWAQRQLVAIGWKSLSVDGVYGPQTVGVVKSFQGHNGLAVDGICGPATWTKLLHS